jgi:endonuclease YncB( thermonuclease family)
MPADIEVYVNGIRQAADKDYVRHGDELVFARRLAKEGRLGFWRWASLFLGIAGTYRQNDDVDVVYEVGGRRHVATGLPIRAGDPREGQGHRPSP